MMEHMLSQFIDGVDVYLGVVKDSQGDAFREVIQRDGLIECLQ